MVVPEAGRSLAAVAGGALVIMAWTSVIGTFVVPRRAGGWVTRWTDRVVNWAFILAAAAFTDHRRHERVLTYQAVTILVVQFAAWLGITFIGFSLLLWPFVTGGITQAFAVAGSSMSTLGFAGQTSTVPPAIVLIAAASGLVLIAPQIAYLPTLYDAYNRRETEVTLLGIRAGEPAWGPELLVRTSLVGTESSLPGLYGQWERWAVDVADTHSAYLPLVRFRSSRRPTSWVTALLAVLDSAALLMALQPGSDSRVPASLCLRSGYMCFRRIARAMGFNVPEDPLPDDEISLSRQEFLKAVDHLRAVGFPIERDPEEAWLHFRGWRVNYERAAYELAKAVDAPPALWSGPRHHRTATISVDPSRGRLSG
jgi:hypothetical protein